MNRELKKLIEKNGISAGRLENTIEMIKKKGKTYDEINFEGFTENDERNIIR